jgi:nucleotide-binding universal stress UspA family protein
MAFMVDKASMQKIMVAVDGSAASEKAAAHAIHLAKMENAELVFTHVIEDIKMGGVIGARAKYGDIKLVEGYNRARKESTLQWMKPLEEQARKDGVKAKSEILYDTGKSVTGMIVEYAQKNNADLVVVGTKGLLKFKRLLVGSVASGVSSHAHCPVLIVR